MSIALGLVLSFFDVRELSRCQLRAVPGLKRDPLQLRLYTLYFSFFIYFITCLYHLNSNPDISELNLPASTKNAVAALGLALGLALAFGFSAGRFIAIFLMKRPEIKLFAQTLLPSSGWEICSAAGRRSRALGRGLGARKVGNEVGGMGEAGGHVTCGEVGVTGAAVHGAGAGGVEGAGAEVDSVEVDSEQVGTSGVVGRWVGSQVEGRLVDSPLEVAGSEGMMAVAVVVVHRGPWVDAHRDHVVAVRKGRGVAAHRGRAVAKRKGHAAAVHKGRGAAAHRDPAVEHRDPVRMGPEQPHRDRLPRRTVAGSQAASLDSQEVGMPALAGSLVDSHGEDTQLDPGFCSWLGKQLSAIKVLYRGGA